MSKNSYNNISKKYSLGGRWKLSPEEVEAYFIARMPATQAAVRHALMEVKKKFGNSIHSVLDLGAGLGAATLAAREVFPQIEEATLVEDNKAMVSKGQEIVNREWIIAPLKEASLAPHDLVVFSYSYGELAKVEQIEILKKSWEAARELLVLVEPGTPKGFGGIIQAREALIGWGGHLVAPCPHHRQCPMIGENQWCHFAARLERTKEHRKAKEGVLGYEDEKYSYVAFSKKEASSSGARIVGYPRKGKGSVSLHLCTEKGLENRLVTKREKEVYKNARKLKWGESIE